MWPVRRIWFFAGLLACLGVTGCRNTDILENQPAGPRHAVSGSGR